MSNDHQQLVQKLIDAAKGQGADAADAMLTHSISMSHSQRLGETEKLEREESQDLSLRVFLGHKQAVVSSTDFDDDAIAELVARAVTMAATVPDDPYCGIADPEQIAGPDQTDVSGLDMADPVEPTANALIDRASRCEKAALAVPGVTNSEGAEAAWGRTAVTLAASNGFTGAYEVSQHSVVAQVIAGEGTQMEGDYDYTVCVHADDLEDPDVIGRRAGERAVSRLNPGNAKTDQVPVVFDPRVSGGLLRHLTGAISGPAIARGTSFLKDSMGDQIFAPGITVLDDPLRRRGLRSRPFDGEGLPVSKTAIIDDGKLTTWLLDLASARQLNLPATGHAGRGRSGPPSPGVSNLYLEPGGQSPEELMADIAQGFYVTSLLGMGVNQVTGDYSRGAAGFWIENGEITRPVSQLTVASNLKDMFKALVPANDLKFRFGVDAPTIRIDGMTVAGAA